MRNLDDPTVRLSASGHDLGPLDAETIEHLSEQLSDEEARVILQHGTEAAFCGSFYDHKAEGRYACRLCGLPLFNSSAKFDSGTGWPSFFAPSDPDHVAFISDDTHGMRRTEITCRRCGGHLGHVFPDGPPPNGERYCLNSVSLEFFEESETLPDRSQPLQTETAYFAGGCFWGIEDAFQHTDGVIDATSGYQGGTTSDPSYGDVCGGSTGHAETVRVLFDPSRVSYEMLLEKFFAIHDASRGPDRKSQYRSAIFTTNEAQMRAATAFIDDLKSRGSREIHTDIRAAPEFFEAEGRHQDYNERHGKSCAQVK